MSKYTDICHVCGGTGKEGGCSRCGLTPRANISVRTLRLDIPVDIIPVPYQGKLWEKPTVEGNVPLKFREFDDTLEKLVNTFLNGKIPKCSVFAAAPAKYGKHEFAYTCMQAAMAHSFSVAPLLTTSDWRRLYRVSQMNPFYKLYDKYKWDDLITKDVVFVSVDHSDDRYDVIGLLKDLLDTRSGFCLPTFIINDYRLTDLTPQWNSEAYSMIYNPVQNRDYNRYPVITHRWEGT